MAKFNIKVCGMRQAANIAAVADLVPDYLGFIFYDKSPRFVSDVSAELIRFVPTSIKTVGVFVNEDVDKVKFKVQQHQLKAVQLHGSESVEYCTQLSGLGIEIIKAFGVHTDFNFDQLAAYEDVVNFFLFDTQTAAHGGSGKVFDWTLLSQYQLQKPYFLSGGIGLEHLEMLKAIEDERLYAVDINSKFESEPGLKDINQLKLFFEGLN